ncbi:MAG: hypothetical protein M3253_09195, partial [Chloroflexota bacterium]|nr:hypothetical protein [Chloroflexota bacterium]
MDYMARREKDREGAEPGPEVVEQAGAGAVARTREGSENETTGRFLVLLRPDETAERAAILRSSADLRVASRSDFLLLYADLSTL